MGFDGLGAGQSFTDPTGSPKITVVDLDNTHATVKVEFPTPVMSATTVPTCLDDTPFTGPGPGPESCAARVASPSGAPPATPDGGATPPPQTPPKDGGVAPKDGPAPAAPDSGTPPGAGGEGGGGAAGAGGAAGGTASDAATTNPVVVSSGCGCRLGSADRGATGSVFACGLALVALVLRRRRRT
jgi:hypothetical protein